MRLLPGDLRQIVAHASTKDPQLVKFALINKDLVLIGGGHAHVGVLASLARRPVPGVRVTLIARDIDTPYSGMLPGYIAGLYSRAQCHIDLRPLCRLAGVRLIHDSATGIDLAASRVVLGARPSLPYDVLSIDIGSTPRLAHIPGAAENALPVKPIDRLAERWERIVADVTGGAPLSRFLTVGGGAAGIEVTLAARYRLRGLLASQGRDPDAQSFTLLTSGEILDGHSAGLRNWFRRHLAAKGVALHERSRVTKVLRDAVLTEDGHTFGFDRLIWVTDAGGAPWLAATGLALDGAGCIKVDATLRALGQHNVFAAGDIASNVDHPRPKAGVFAVRQGMPLAENLARVLAGDEPRPFVPQRRFLTLISAGEPYAVAARGPWLTHGQLMWRWKDHIDRTWMRQFQQPDDLRAAAMHAAGSDMSAPALPLPAASRCGGGAAKAIGAPVLSRVMARLQPKSSADVDIGRATPDHAVIVRMPPGKLAVQTVNDLRGFLDDHYLMGRVAAVHALSDVYAMGGTPRTVQAIAVLPPATDALMEEDLYQLLRGALDVIEAADAVLVGGHASEGRELSLGFAVTGTVEEPAVLRQSGMRAGDKLVLTKSLGSGALFAADLRARAQGADIDAALAMMQRSNAHAVPVLRAHGVTALTHVSSSGLAGHLHDMLTASHGDATVDLSALPAMAGATAALADDIENALPPSRRQLAASISNAAIFAPEPRFALFFDPQTAGGLLASVPPARAMSCIDALRQAGYGDAAIIGEVGARAGPAPSITLKS